MIFKLRLLLSNNSIEFMQTKVEGAKTDHATQREAQKKALKSLQSSEAGVVKTEHFKDAIMEQWRLRDMLTISALVKLNDIFEADLQKEQMAAEHKAVLEEAAARHGEELAKKEAHKKEIEQELAAQAKARKKDKKKLAEALEWEAARVRAELACSSDDEA